MTRLNVATPEGREMGQHIARLCDGKLKGKPDNRCGTCAARAGDHLANGSPETLISFTRCLMERTPFWCHEADRPCAGWLALRFPSDQIVEAPWNHVEPAEPAWLVATDGTVTIPTG